MIFKKYYLISIFVFLIVYYKLWKITLIVAIIFSYFQIKKYLNDNANLGFKKIKPSIMVILGSGGHTWEMINVLSNLKWENYLPIYIIGFSDSHSLNDIIFFEKKFNRDFFYERLIRPREHCHNTYSLKVLFRSFYCFFKSFKIIYQHKPDYILANGPSICVPIIMCGWLLKKMGYISTKLIYIESAARVNNLSISAKLIKNFVDDMFGFWNQLCKTFKLQQLISGNFLSNNIKKSTLNETKDKSILVTVGTTQFEELIKLALKTEFQNELLKNGYSKLFIQIGNYKLNENYKSNSNLKIEIINFMPSFKFNNLIKNCNLIISHGGAGTLIQCILNGKKPIAIPNKFVNENHQIELINELNIRGYIYTCTIENLLEFLSSKFSKLMLENNSFNKLKLSNEFLESIGENKISNNISQNLHITNNKIISIVIPCISKDISRLRNLLISIHKFVSKDIFEKIYIIVPEDDYKQFFEFIKIENEIIQFQGKIEIIKESYLVPLNTFSKNSLFFLKNKDGWFKQQILKLAIADKINTKFYLILDSDCLFNKNLSSSDIFIEKNNTVLSYLQEEEIYIHDKWWNGSAEFLGITKPFLASLKTGIGVTPQILSVDIVKKLCHFIKDKSHNDEWYSILWSNRIVHFYPLKIWTEYTLYYLFAKRAGLLDKYHIMKKNSFCDYYKSVWELHESFEWNPFKSYCISSPILVFQSNTKLSHLIPRAFLSQYESNNFQNFISCILFIDKNNLCIKDKNSILMSLNCFIGQSWPNDKKELILFCNKQNKKTIKELIKNKFEYENIIIAEIKKEKNILENINDNIDGNYIALWPMNCWSSPYRLSIQYDFLNEEKINKCYVSPYIEAYPEKEKFFVSENNHMLMDIIDLKISLFCKRDYLDKKGIEIKPINEPTIFIEIKDDYSLKNKSNRKDAIRSLQNRNSISLFYQLIRITNPFLYKSSIIPLRKKRRIYIISSELEFIPVIGGINTFLRVIISELKQSKIHLNKETEFVFIGIQTNSSSDSKNIPNIEGVFFKFFPTKKSREYDSLNIYFKSFEKYSLIVQDLQIFGELATNWVEQDAIPGDICISTIIYELNKESLKMLNKKGIKLVHTVHSLVPLKIINNIKYPFSTNLYLKERIGTFLFFKILGFDEYTLRKYYNNFFINKLIPKIVKYILDMEDFIMNISQIIIVPSKRLSNIAANLYYYNKHKIRCIPWGLPDENILGEPLIYYKKRYSELNENDQKIKCLALCKIIPQKGIDLLLDTFIYIQNANPSLAKTLELNICGDMSYMREEIFKQLLNEKIKKLDKIKVYFKGWVTGEPKIQILADSDLFLLPSLTEPFGFCLLEAMKAGLPIISFNTEGPEDIITNKFGRIVKISEYNIMVKDFGNAIIDICQSENYNKLRDFAAEEIKQWSIKKLINNILSV